MLIWAILVEGMLVQEKLVEDAGEVHALKHQHVSHDLARHECVLHLFVRNEVVQPVFAELWNASELEEIGRLHAWANLVLLDARREAVLLVGRIGVVILILLISVFGFNTWILVHNVLMGEVTHNLLVCYWSLPILLGLNFIQVLVAH